MVQYCIKDIQMFFVWILPIMQYLKDFQTNSTRSGIPENPMVDTKIMNLIISYQKLYQFSPWPWSKRRSFWIFTFHVNTFKNLGGYYGCVMLNLVLLSAKYICCVNLGDLLLSQWFRAARLNSTLRAHLTVRHCRPVCWVSMNRLWCNRRPQPCAAMTKAGQKSHCMDIHW